jgi:hypothetical protein
MATDDPLSAVRIQFHALLEDANFVGEHSETASRDSLKVCIESAENHYRLLSDAIDRLGTEGPVRFPLDWQRQLSIDGNRLLKAAKALAQRDPPDDQLATYRAETQRITAAAPERFELMEHSFRYYRPLRVRPTGSADPAWSAIPIGKIPLFDARDNAIGWQAVRRCPDLWDRNGF